MKLKYDMVVQEVGDTFIAVTVGEKAERDGIETYVNLNDTGAEIVELLREERSKEQITDCLLEEYDAPRDVIAQCVDEVTQSLSVLIEE